MIFHELSFSCDSFICVSFRCHGNLDVCVYLLPRLILRKLLLLSRPKALRSSTCVITRHGQVRLTHFRPMFYLCRNQVVVFYQQKVWKTPVEEWHFTSKNQLPGLSVGGTLVENGLIRLHFERYFSHHRDGISISRNIASLRRLL